jgi:hypothetical protein
MQAAGDGLKQAAAELQKVDDVQHAQEMQAIALNRTRQRNNLDKAKFDLDDRLKNLRIEQQNSDASTLATYDDAADAILKDTIDKIDVEDTHLVQAYEELNRSVRQGKTSYRSFYEGREKKRSDAAKVQRVVNVGRKMSDDYQRLFEVNDWDEWAEPYLEDAAQAIGGATEGQKPEVVDEAMRAWSKGVQKDVLGNMVAAIGDTDDPDTVAEATKGLIDKLESNVWSDDEKLALKDMVDRALGQQHRIAAADAKQRVDAGWNDIASQFANAESQQDLDKIELEAIRQTQGSMVYTPKKIGDLKKSFERPSTPTAEADAVLILSDQNMDQRTKEVRLMELRDSGRLSGKSWAQSQASLQNKMPAKASRIVNDFVKDIKQRALLGEPLKGGATPSRLERALGKVPVLPFLIGDLKDNVELIDTEKEFDTLAIFADNYMRQNPDASLDDLRKATQSQVLNVLGGAKRVEINEAVRLAIDKMEVNRIKRQAKRSTAPEALRDLSDEELLKLEPK